MKAKEFIPASKPRNFVVKNQKTAGAGAHKDKKRAEKQGDVKHKQKQFAEEAAGVGIVTKQNATVDVPVGGEYMNVKKLFPKKKKADKQGVAEAADIGQEWMSDTELDQYVPDRLQQQWRELLGYDQNGNPSSYWANLTGTYEPDVRNPKHRSLMVKVANKWFATKKIPNVKFFNVKDADDELEWLVQIGEKGVDEDMTRRGFLRGLGAVAAGAAGLGASGAAQARATPEWMKKVAQAKQLLGNGLTPEQVAKKLGVTGPNNGMAGPMGGDWGAINSAVQQTKRPDANEGMAESDRKQLSVQQLATISDEALDKAYGYGRSSPGNTFGWQANLKSAAYAKQMIDKGVTDIEAISDAIHKGWNVTAKAFVQNPDQFDDTEKLKAAGKLEAKLQQRKKLMNISYNQLPDDEQEKDRVVARALLQAINGQQGVAEGAVKNLMMDLRAMTDQEFQSRYKMTKAEARANLRKKNEEVTERVRDPEEWDEGDTEPPNNFAVYINGKKWKVFQGRGQFADDYKEMQHFRQLQTWAQQKSSQTGKKWEVYKTGEAPTA